jgi:hypothetical protein
MAKSQSSSRSASSGQKMSKASNAIRRAIGNRKSAVKTTNNVIKGGVFEE